MPYNGVIYINIITIHDNNTVIVIITTTNKKN